MDVGGSVGLGNLPLPLASLVFEEWSKSGGGLTMSETQAGYDGEPDASEMGAADSKGGNDSL